MSKFIPRYEFPSYNIPKTDFKGHQLKALKKFNSLRPQLNLILELRDIRAPLSTRNVLIDQLIDPRIHQRLVVYTKKDLIQPNDEYLQRLSRWHQEIDEDFILINGKQRQSVSNVLKCVRWYKKQLESRNNGLPLPTGYKVLVTGMPNVGKSTLINSLKASPKKVARTGAEAGITRSTSEYIRITDDENIYLIDTPGIGLPGRLHGATHRMLTLSLCGCVKSNLIDPVIQADYLLYLMNLQQGRFYPGPPTNDVYALLNRISHGRAPDHETSAAVSWLAQPRSGLIYDPEMLLDTTTFSLQAYLATQRSLLGDFRPAAPSDQRASSAYDKMLRNVNQLFPKPNR